MQGFNALDMWDRFDEAYADLRRWDAEGKLIHRETVFEGTRVLRRRAQRSVHRRQHRQDAGEGQRAEPSRRSHVAYSQHRRHRSLGAAPVA